MQWAKYRRLSCVAVASDAVTTFDLIASTVRSGRTIDEVEFEVPGAPPATAYIIGRETRRPRGAVLALHGVNGNKADLLPDLNRLSDHGLLCVAIDSPATRRLHTDRTPAGALQTQFRVAQRALAIMTAYDDVLPHQIGLIGHDAGGEVVARLAATTDHIRAAAISRPLPHRSEFIATSDHALAAGVRRDHADLAMLTAELGDFDLVDQLNASPGTHWLIQTADDDDRLSDSDKADLGTHIPRTVRLSSHHTRGDIRGRHGRSERVDFVAHLCG